MFSFKKLTMGGYLHKSKELYNECLKAKEEAEKQ